MSPRNPEAVLLHVRVQPKARANAVKGWHGAALRVSVTAAPEDGKANRVRGAASRDKWFRLPQGVKIPE
jgi:uncharacterized protein YggU (UPF0235/DUF167 family)